VQSLFERLHPDVVIHTAADWSTEKAMREVIVEGTENVARAARKLGIRLIHLSTDVVFDGEGGCYTEENKPSPVHAYGKAKYESEQIVLETCADSVVVRTSLIIGTDWQDAQSRWLREDILNRKRVTLFVDEIRSPVWVHELAEGLVTLALSDYRGTLHMSGPQGLTRYQLGTFLLDMQGLDASTVIPTLARESGLERPLNCTLDISRAREVIGFSPSRIIPDLEGLICSD
jgi:dTDP-4-dehydrorhamnose reductase